MKVVAAIFSLVFVCVFELYTDAYMWRYVGDFIFSGMALQSTLLYLFVWSLLILWRALRKEKITSRYFTISVITCAVLGVWASLCWGAFGLGSLMVFLLFWVYPKIVRIPLKNPEFRVTLILFLQSLFVTGPIWFQLF